MFTSRVVKDFNQDQENAELVMLHSVGGMTMGLEFEKLLFSDQMIRKHDHQFNLQSTLSRKSGGGLSKRNNVKGLKFAKREGRSLPAQICLLFLVIRFCFCQNSVHVHYSCLGPNHGKNVNRIFPY